MVDGSETGYLKTVCDYVHLNPVRRQTARSGGQTARLCLEQLWRISEGAKAAAQMVVRRSAAGRARRAQGQFCRPPGICPAHGTTAGGRGWSGIQAAVERLVPGERGISKGVAPRDAPETCRPLRD